MRWRCREPTVGVVDPVQRGLGALVRLLCELEDGASVSGIEQALEVIEHLMHAGSPPRGVAVVE